MPNILCFGDSNTHGCNPSGGRWPRDVRWTGRLQEILGPDYYVIEEGLNGRTTVFDDPLEFYRNGLTALPYSLRTHTPLDMVIICLGTNDCKSFYSATAGVITRGMERLCMTIENFGCGANGQCPKILIACPIHISDGSGTPVPYLGMDDDAIRKSRELSPLYKEVAARHDCLFFDAADVAKCSSIDQLHMDAENHGAFAEGIARVIKEYFE